MNAELEVWAEFILLFAIIGGVLMVMVIIPAIWLAVRKKSLDKFLRFWCPIGIFLAAVSGIVAIRDSWSVKLTLIAVMAPLITLATYLGRLLYSRLKGLFKL